MLFAIQEALIKKVKMPFHLPWILMWALILVINTPAEAYFIVFAEKKPINAFATRSILQSGVVQNQLLLSSNDETHHQFSSCGPSTPLKLLYFCYIDRLPLPNIISRTDHTFVDNNFSIDNLLYANLKLARLIHEYENLRKKSEAVLEGLDVPYILQGPGYDETISWKAPDIVETADKLLSYSHVVEVNGYDILQNHGWDGVGAISPRRRAIGQWNHTDRKFATNLSGGKFSRGQFRKKDFHSGDSNGEQMETQPEKLRLKYGVDAETELSWLLRMIIAAPKYIYQHKIESSIYFLMVYGIIHVLFRPKR